MDPLRWLIRTTIFSLILMLIYVCVVEPFVLGGPNRIQQYFGWMYPTGGAG